MSRTFSVRDLNETDVLPPAPPPYNFGSDEEDNAGGNVGFQQAEFPGREREPEPELGIDEISPDEDERTAEAALHAMGKYVPCNRYSTKRSFPRRSPAHDTHPEGMITVSCVLLR
jgi:hypothetical protein